MLPTVNKICLTNSALWVYALPLHETIFAVRIPREAYQEIAGRAIAAGLAVNTGMLAIHFKFRVVNPDSGDCTIPTTPHHTTSDQSHGDDASISGSHLLHIRYVRSYILPGTDYYYYCSVVNRKECYHHCHSVIPDVMDIE